MNRDKRDWKWYGAAGWCAAALFGSAGILRYIEADNFAMAVVLSVGVFAAVLNAILHAIGADQ